MADCKGRAMCWLSTKVYVLPNFVARETVEGGIASLVAALTQSTGNLG